MCQKVSDVSFCIRLQRGHMSQHMSTEMNPVLINCSADKIYAWDLNYAQTYEFVASVSVLQDSQQSQFWLQIELGLFTTLNAILQGQIWEKCERKCKKQSWRETGLLRSMSLHRERCYAWKMKSYCTDFPK